MQRFARKTGLGRGCAGECGARCRGRLASPRLVRAYGESGAILHIAWVEPNFSRAGSICGTVGVAGLPAMSPSVASAMKMSS